MKYREVLAVLHAHGFEKVRQRGSHRILKRTVRGRAYVVTVAVHKESDDVAPKTLASIIRQSGLKKKHFR